MDLARSVDLVGVGPSGRSRRDYGELNASRKLHVCIPDRGHQTIVYVLPKDRPPPPTYQHSPVVSEYFRHCEEERRRTRGDGARLLGAPGEIFPNVALLPRQVICGRRDYSSQPFRSRRFSSPASRRWRRPAIPWATTCSW